ncbi:CemA-like proton extrusion protein-related [Zea mays]|uniref:CemA-like proton extrusion protein-related n=1 Tax=Zea mays TaxID=4577 RepID=A0A1D6PLM3_MAIZE|nr:CemA-like proton extrusion protein-related [Zea mays]
MSCSAVASDGIALHFPTPSRAGPSAEEEVSARAGRVQKVSLAAELLDSKKARYCLEVEIGKSPPLSDDDVWLRC